MQPQPAEQRKLNTEVYTISAREAEEYLLKQGYARSDSGVFVKRATTV